MSGPGRMDELTCDDVRAMAGAYVLGALDPIEEAAVRDHVSSHADAHPEIGELGSVLPALAELVPAVEPPPALKARIMAAAAADLADRAGARGAAPPIRATAPVAFPSAAERADRRARTSTGGWLLRIAAVLAIAILGGWNLLLQNQLSSAQQYERNVAAVLDVAAQAGSLTAILTADGGSGSGLAAVDSNGGLAMAMRELAPTSGNEVYEAWVIGGDGVPVPLGSFRVGSSGIALFESSGLPAAEGIILALTREPGPGATSPTMPIISKGVAASPG